MSEEEKDILIRDLCARLPYGVKIESEGYYLGVVVSIEKYNLIACNNVNGYDITKIKPYLFPMSSMTEGLKNEMHPISKIDINDVEPLVLKQYFSYFDWLNENHFDYRGLIKRGLAIDATNLNIY